MEVKLVSSNDDWSFFEINKNLNLSNMGLFSRIFGKKKVNVSDAIRKEMAGEAKENEIIIYGERSKEDPKKTVLEISPMYPANTYIVVFEGEKELFPIVHFFAQKKNGDSIFIYADYDFQSRNKISIKFKSKPAHKVIVILQHAN